MNVHIKKPLVGLKFFKPIEDLLKELQKKYPNPNRKLTFDRYLALLLLAYFNPVISSLRGLQAALDIKKIKKQFDLPSISLGSLSEASHLFDPVFLKEVFLTLAQQAGAVDGIERPESVPKELRIVASDATLWKLLPRMNPGLYEKPLTRQRKGEFKGHVLFDVEKGTPIGADFTDGKVDERAVMSTQLAPNILYLLDRGYVSQPLYDKILKANSSFIGRAKEDRAFTVQQDLPLDEKAQSAGVYSDQRVFWGTHSKEKLPLRLVLVRKVSPPPNNLHPRRRNGKHQAYDRDLPCEQEIALLTNRFDITAEEVAKLYTYRWHIETFFRWFKCTLGCRHLFAESENGMCLQFYSALIASLLVVIYSNRKPNKRLWERIQFFLMGIATAEEVMMVVEKCKAQVSRDKNQAG